MPRTSKLFALPFQALESWSRLSNDAASQNRGSSSGADEDCGSTRAFDLPVGTDAKPEIVLQEMVRNLIPDVASHHRVPTSAAAMHAGLLEDVALSPMKRGRSYDVASALDDEEETVSKRSRHDIAMGHDRHDEIIDTVDETVHDASDSCSTTLSGADAVVAAARSESEESNRFTAQLEQWSLDSKAFTAHRTVLVASVSVDERRSPGAGGNSVLQAAAATVKASRLEEQGFEAQLARHL